MNILGIETSTACCSVGFFNEDASVERSLVESRIHSEKLQSLIKEVLQEAKTSIEALDAVAVSIGPGSFTGLRIGLCSAKGLCYAIDRPLITVSTFKVIATAAAQIHEQMREFVVMLDAKQSEFYFGRYTRTAVLIEPETEVTVKPLSECLDGLAPHEHLLLVTDAGKHIQAACGEKMNVESPEKFCRGDVVARIGIQQYRSKQFADLANVEPLYLKDFLVKQERVSTHG